MLTLLALSSCLIAPGTRLALDEAPASAMEIREGLVLAGAGRPGRTPLPTDLVTQQLIRGEWKRPEAGSTIDRPNGEPLRWSTLSAGEDGVFQGRGLAGGYLFSMVEAPEEGVRILEASGHAMVFVNREPRAGDPYSNGMTRLPVLLKKGENELLFRTGRGRLQAKLVKPKADAMLSAADPTLPDLVAGEVAAAWAAVPVLNALAANREDLWLESRVGDGPATMNRVPSMVPLSARKVPFRFETPAESEPGTVVLSLRLLGADRTVLDELKFDLRVRSPEQTRKRTFISSIDGSVQYYAHLPMKSNPERGERPALFLTLHGASVEAIGQADAYGAKAWGHLVAPTNRRPFGFDWEDWGRLDAMEVLQLASKELGTDPDRTYLTGHSMGGHGTWHIGATYPGTFAAIGPSAGWVSMWSYAGASLSPDSEGQTPEALLSRAASPSNTLALKSNYGMLGVYVLHGDADDNVPVDQARTMRGELGQFHSDFAYYERPGAGHWWGNECVDWPPLFEFLQRHKRPPAEQVRRVVFTTANPGVSSEARWVAIEDQVRRMAMSRVELEQDPASRMFTGKTENVARLRLDLAHLEPGAPVKVELDGQGAVEAAWPKTGTQVWLSRSSDGTWSLSGMPSASEKGPHRAGPFKDAFRNRMVFVYGTKGTPEETAWAIARARFDAEVFGYQGNGSVDVVADTAFDPSAEPDRNVIAYGNSDTHENWESLLGSSPVQIERGVVRVGEREAKGTDLGCLFIRPRHGSQTASVAVVSGSGIAGFRLTDRLPLFVSGVAYPDFFLADPLVLSEGTAGLVACGYFGNDWSVERGEFSWADRVRVIQEPRGGSD